MAALGAYFPFPHGGGRTLRCVSCRGGVPSPPGFPGSWGMQGPTDVSAGYVPLRDPFTGGHIGPPLREAESVPEPTGIGAGRNLLQRGGTEQAPYRRRSRPARPGRRGKGYGSNAGSAQQRADVPKAWLPPTKFRVEIWGVSHGHRPLRGEGEVPATTQASGAQRSVCASGWEEGVGIRAGIIPQRGHQPRAIPQSRPLAVTAPFTQGSLWGRGMQIAASARWASSQ